ncbi:hypothetical protein [Mangrovicoccus sp. HB161399]|uniref:hypothetical protein n=1 Tax=Mangrovicoccus sp. HB161399 TaxID=2720392 RepID=UPI0015582528|nr:hypothetical protein [Mangrovicoccus sp. HB161399]
MPSSVLKPVSVACSILLVIIGLLALEWIATGPLRGSPPPAAELGVQQDEIALEASSRAAYNAWAYSHTRRVFEWQLRSAIYLFWVSMLITVSGVSFAFWQFAQAAQFERIVKDADEVTFKAGMASLAFRTRSVASFVMLVSVIYLLIYVIFIFKIHGGGVPTAATAASDASAVAASAEGSGYGADPAEKPVDDISLEIRETPQPGGGNDIDIEETGE